MPGVDQAIDNDLNAPAKSLATIPHDDTVYTIFGALVRYHVIAGSTTINNNCITALVTAEIKLICSSNVTESLGLVCIVGSVWSRAWRWGSSFFPVTTSVLPSDQTHVKEREQHADCRKPDFHGHTSGVSWTLRLWEQISGADTLSVVSHASPTSWRRLGSLTRQLVLGQQRGEQRWRGEIRFRHCWRSR